MVLMTYNWSRFNSMVRESIRDTLEISQRKSKKSKAIPVAGHEGPQSCETLRVPHYLDNRLKDGGKAVSLTRRPRFTPQENYLINSWYSFLLEAE
jgi:hypothetical protein